MNIPFSPPYIDEDIINEVVDTMKSGWITTGPKVKALEIEVSNYVGITSSLCVNSWTSGAILVFKWLGLKEGDEVIIPAYTYSATALAILQCGAKPVMVDICNDYTIDIDKVRLAITANTKVIMPVDIAGWPCDYDRLYELLSEKTIAEQFIPRTEIQKKINRILVLSDAAHSIGAIYKSKKAGQLADITVFSLHAVKNVTTAEGGVICLNLPAPFDNKEEYKLMKLYSLNGQTKDAFAKSQAGSWRYDILFAGLKVNMPDLCAAIGLIQMKKYDYLKKERKRVAFRYKDFFSNYEWACLPPIIDETRESSYHLYALRIKGITEEQRDEIIESIGSRGVAVNVHFIPMPMLTLFKDLGFKIENFPNSYKQFSIEISLPIYPQLSNEQVDMVCKAVYESYQSCINK